MAFVGVVGSRNEPRVSEIFYVPTCTSGCKHLKDCQCQLVASIFVVDGKKCNQKFLEWSNYQLIVQLGGGWVYLSVQKVI